MFSPSIRFLASTRKSNSGDIFVRRYRTDKQTGQTTLLPPLRCPGGPRMSSEDLKSLYRVPTCGHLAKYDWRFIMNLNTTNQLVKNLNRTKAVDKLYIELGPGPGMLTRSLLTLPSLGVFGIELDSKYDASLDQIRAQTQGRFSWANADVTNIDEAALLEETFPEVTNWLATTAQASTFVELRQKMQSMRERRAVRDDRTRSFEFVNKKEDENGLRGVTDEDLDEMLARDQDPTRQFAGERTREDILRSPFADDEAGDPGSIGPITGGSCEATSTLWRGSPKLEVVGNLPFEIAAEMSLRYAVDCSRRHNLFKYGRIPFHLFYQKEMAERMIAAPGSANFGRISVVLQNYFSVQLRQTFLEKTYYPSTEVLGALVTLEPRITPVVDVDGAVLSNFCDIVLNPKQRTQSIFSALKRCMPTEVAVYVLSELRIDGNLMPTMITAPEISKMALLWVRYLEATSQAATSEKPFQQSASEVTQGRRKRRHEQEDENLKAGLGLDDGTTTDEEGGTKNEGKKTQAYW